ncbi:LysR substrate-binding domain-containing protein [Microbacterium sp. NPDC055683]
MEIRDLEAFIAVAEELHFGRAAERLRISQPPLSSRIRQLERELGLELFARSTRAVALTAAGARLLGSARQVVAQVRSTRAVAEALKTGEDGVVRLGFAGVSSHRVLPLLSHAVRAAHPRIDLQLRSQTYVYTAVELLREGEIDLAFSRLPAHPDLDSRVVEIERIVCAIPEHHPLAHHEAIRMDDLADADFVSLPGDQGSILQATMLSLCIAAGFRPHVVQEAPDSATVLALVAAGVGVTITLSSVAPARDLGIVYREIDDIRPSHMFATLTWRRGDDSPALARVLGVSEIALPTPDISGFANNPFIKSIGRE